MSRFPAPKLNPPSLTFSELKALGLRGALKSYFASAVTTAAPTAAPTVAEGSAAGTFTAGSTLWFCYTELDANKAETLPSPAASFTVTDAAKAITVTFPAVQAGNKERNVYIATAEAGPFYYAMGTLFSNPAGDDLDITAAPDSSAAQAPAVAGTGLPGAARAALLGACSGRLQHHFDQSDRLLSMYLAGEPIDHQDLMDRLYAAASAFAALSGALTVAGQLVADNPGEVGPHTLPIGTAGRRRFWA